MSGEPIKQTRYMTVGMVLGLMLGGAAGLTFGLMTEQTPLWIILGAGGGMMVGMAAGSAVDRFVEKRSTT